jgi:hypothetical protein
VWGWCCHPCKATNIAVWHIAAIVGRIVEGPIARVPLRSRALEPPPGKMSTTRDGESSGTMRALGCCVLKRLRGSHHCLSPLLHGVGRA